MHVRVRVSPAGPADLPAGVSAAVLADDEIVGAFYARTLEADAERRCAAVSAALTAGLEAALRNRQDNGRIDLN